MLKFRNRFLIYLTAISAGALLISNLSDNFSLRGTEGLTRTVIHYTLVSEGIGLLFLVPGFLLSGYGVWQSLWYGVFHAITGFCNAGLSPFDDSLIGQSRLTQFGVACMIGEQYAEVGSKGQTSTKIVWNIEVATDRDILVRCK